MAEKPQNMPFRVVTGNGTLVSGHNDQAEADESAKARNARAKDLGVKADYSAVEKP